ncbi:MAG: metallophosphoesterase [Oscillospiraceae bacterium]|nr:metallophosphoesterase [Oscillospiraceae bacterium]
MKKLLSCALVLTLLCVLLPGAAHGEDGYTLLVATDPHFIAPSLTDHGLYFTALTENSDGKLMKYSEEIMDAFLAEAIAQKPEALLLTGDLTFNGALLSHTALAAKLREAEAAGLRIYVLTGNHDLDNPNAALFSGAEFQRVPFAESADFRRIYADFGFDEALSIDTDSLSYVVDLNEDTRLLMLDFNTRHDPCGISDKSLEWVEEQLRAARDAGLHVLAAGHQNIFQLTVFRAGYVIGNADRLAELFRRYGVTLYLSGHLHCQHWKTEQGLTEIATSALAVSPCQYGVLTVSGDKLSYQTKETDVTAWAKERGRTEAELLDFPAYAADFFDGRNRASTAETLSLFHFTSEEVEYMTEYIVRLNRAYFSGDMRAAASFDPDGEIAALFDRTANLYTAYLASVRPDYGMDFRTWGNNN